MKIRTLVGLILQLMAIQFILTTILGWGPYVISGTSFLPFSDASREDILRYRIFFGVAIVAAVFMCAFAKDIAAHLIAGEETIFVGNLSLVDCYTIAFFVVAISFIISTVVQVVFFVVETLKTVMTDDGRKMNLDFWTLLQTFGPPVIGFAILLNARSMAAAYARKQQLISGEKPGLAAADAEGPT